MSGPADIVPRPLAEVLRHLVAVASRLVERPALLAVVETELDALAIEVAAWIRRPSEGGRLVDERCAWLIDSLKAAGAARDDERDGWARLAAVLLDHVKRVRVRAEAQRPSP